MLLFKSLVAFHAKNKNIQPEDVIKGLLDGKQAYKSFAEASSLLLGKTLEAEFLKTLGDDCKINFPCLTNFLYATFFTTPIRENKSLKNK